MDRLIDHSVYKNLKSIDDVKFFMQYHAFAVWDFMSLVKALQTHFAPTTLPWFNPQNTDVARFINEIVLSEESDMDSEGNYRSHYAMYLNAMSEVGASTEPIETFVGELKDGTPLFETIAGLNLPVELKQFLKFTFETIESRDIHKIAAAFTFGREDIIPEMFLQVLKNSDELRNAPKFRYYLERHIELDGDEHGPMALKLMEVACGQDKTKWLEAAECARRAIDVRVNLWSMIDRKLSVSTQNTFSLAD
ncbi:MAG: DUF3050 domain-containing protein [Flavobacteriales bacterium]|nr:DUF3050 domain-containing protein [Flavobacteriales bacterium]